MGLGAVEAPVGRTNGVSLRELKQSSGQGPLESLCGVGCVDTARECRAPCGSRSFSPPCKP